nr:aspartic proteinase cdr1 [Quercus suber]
MASSVRFYPCFLVASILLYYVIGLLATAHNVPKAQLTPYKGQHLMKVSIGTPPIDIYDLTDTSSSLMWTQCPVMSDTINQNNVIYYWMKPLVLLKIFAISILDMQVVYPKVFWPKKKLPSLLPQGKRFPLTLLLDVHTTIPSTSMQWESLENSSPPITEPTIIPYVPSTPFLRKSIRVSKDPSYLQDYKCSNVITDQFDNSNHAIKSGSASHTSGRVSKGNTIIDSGTPEFGLSPEFYDRLVVEVKKHISIDPIMDDSLLGTWLCYRTEITNGPILTIHFEDADVELKPIQTFNRPLKEMFLLSLCLPQLLRFIYLLRN